MKRADFFTLCDGALTDGGRHLYLHVTKWGFDWVLTLTGSKWKSGMVYRLVYHPNQRFDVQGEAFVKCNCERVKYQRWLDDWKAKKFPKGGES